MSAEKALTPRQRDDLRGRFTRGRIDNLTRARQQIHHCESHNGGFFLTRHQPCKLQVTLELSGVNHKNKSIWLHPVVLSFDDPARQFFFRRRCDHAEECRRRGRR